MRDPDALISTGDLAARLGQPGLRIYDCTTYLQPPDPGSDDPLSPQFHRDLEPSRYGRPGRVPGSVNVPAANLVDVESKRFVSVADATTAFTAAGIAKERRGIAYCGGGISATIDLFLLHHLGFDDLTLYDGSMGEWAKDHILPTQTG